MESSGPRGRSSSADLRSAPRSSPICCFEALLSRSSAAFDQSVLLPLNCFSFVSEAAPLRLEASQLLFCDLERTVGIVDFRLPIRFDFGEAIVLFGLPVLQLRELSIGLCFALFGLVDGVVFCGETAVAYAERANFGAERAEDCVERAGVAAYLLP